MNIAVYNNSNNHKNVLINVHEKDIFKSLTWFKTGPNHLLYQNYGCKYTLSNDALSVQQLSYMALGS